MEAGYHPLDKYHNQDNYFISLLPVRIFLKLSSHNKQKLDKKMMLRNKLKTMDETVPDLGSLLHLVDHHKGDQVHDEHD